MRPRPRSGPSRPHHAPRCPRQLTGGRRGLSNTQRWPRPQGSTAEMAPRPPGQGWAWRGPKASSSRSSSPRKGSPTGRRAEACVTGERLWPGSFGALRDEGLVHLGFGLLLRKPCSPAWAFLRSQGQCPAAAWPPTAAQARPHTLCSGPPSALLPTQEEPREATSAGGQAPPDPGVALGVTDTTWPSCL